MYTFFYILNTWNFIYLKMIKTGNFILHIFFTTIKKIYTYTHEHTYSIHIHTSTYTYAFLFISLKFEAPFAG